MNITAQTMTEFAAANTEHVQFTLDEIERLVTYREAVRAGYFNEGSLPVHLAMLMGQP